MVKLGPLPKTTAKDVGHKDEYTEYSDPLVGFLYQIMRDHLPSGVVEEAVKANSGHESILFANKWLANYANDLAQQLRSQ